jgi:hypothetical protein
MARLENAAHDEAMRAERTRRFEARKAELRGDTAAWKGGPFDERVEVLLAQLAAAGDPAHEMRDAILLGINAAAKQGRLDEQHVSFVEDKARKEVARVSLQGKVVPAQWQARTLTDLAEVHPACLQLPEVVQRAAIDKVNGLGEQLGAIGFKSELEVDASCPAAAQGLARGLREIHTALILLGVARFRTAKGYKASSEARLDYAEDYATKVLGMETRSHAGIKMDLALTTDGLRQASRPRVARDEPAAFEPIEAEPTGMYVGKLVAVSDDHLVQKIGRSPRDLVRHRRGEVCGDVARAGDIVAISYEMGMARLANQSLAKAGVER